MDMRFMPPHTSAIVARRARVRYQKSDRPGERSRLPFPLHANDNTSSGIGLTSYTDIGVFFGVLAAGLRDVLWGA